MIYRKQIENDKCCFHASRISIVSIALSIFLSFYLLFQKLKCIQRPRESHRVFNCTGIVEMNVTKAHQAKKTNKSRIFCDPSIW